MEVFKMSGQQNQEMPMSRDEYRSGPADRPKRRPVEKVRADYQECRRQEEKWKKTTEVDKKDHWRYWHNAAQMYLDELMEY